MKLIACSHTKLDSEKFQVVLSKQFAFKQLFLRGYTIRSISVTQNIPNETYFKLRIGSLNTFDEGSENGIPLPLNNSFTQFTFNPPVLLTETSCNATNRVITLELLTSKQEPLSYDDCIIWFELQ